MCPTGSVQQRIWHIQSSRGHPKHVVHGGIQIGCQTLPCHCVTGHISTRMMKRATFVRRSNVRRMPVAVGAHLAFFLKGKKKQNKHAFPGPVHTNFINKKNLGHAGMLLHFLAICQFMWFFYFFVFNAICTNDLYMWWLLMQTSAIFVWASAWRVNSTQRRLQWNLPLRPPEK